MVVVEELQGRWRRSLLLGPDGRQDTTTEVTWLQAQSLFADLRRPVEKPHFGKARSLRELSLAQLEWIASQEGFAGRFARDDDVFEWQRMIDFQPEASVLDRARLRFDEDGLLVEEGAEADYIEHWHRQGEPRAAGALLLRDPDGRWGVFVVVNAAFMFARGRLVSLPRGKHLRDCVRAAPSLEAAQDLVDCEISLGSVHGDWRIEHSTLPYREGERLKPLLTPGGNRFSHADHTPEGEPFAREWTIVEREGILAEGTQGETPPEGASHYAVQESSP